MECTIQTQAETELMQQSKSYITRAVWPTHFTRRRGGCENDPLSNVETESHENTKFGMGIDVHKSFFIKAGFDLSRKHEIGYASKMTL